MSLKRNAWVVVLALALSGAMVAGCGDKEENNGGSGGTGGVGGTGGGEGGTGGGEGGTGGGEPETCVPECFEGEECIEDLGEFVCQCEPGSCPEGQFCNDDLRCEVEPIVDDFVDCTEPEAFFPSEDDPVFFCTDWMHPTGGTWWIRLCGAPEHCLNTQTFCVGLLPGLEGIPFCYFNLCGEASIGPGLEPPLPGNGVPFGTCSSSMGYVDIENPVLDGTCTSPWTYEDGTSAGVCVTTGTAPKGGDCKPDAYRNDTADNCVHDAMCLRFPADDPRRPCENDAECETVPVTIDGTTYNFAGYCGKDGTCQTLGFCGDACNAGSAGFGVHDDAGCSDPEWDECVLLSDTNRAVETGYCYATCEMFALDACPEYPEGQQRVCYPAFDEDLRGSCIPQTDAPNAVGESCDDTLDEMDCPDNAACLRFQGDSTGTCVQWCQCDAGWDEEGLCNDQAAHDGCAPDGTVCAGVYTNSPIGFCATLTEG